MAFQPGYQPFPAFGLELTHGLFLGLQAVRLQSQTKTTPSSLLDAALGTCQPPRSRDPTLHDSFTIFLRLYSHLAGSAPLEETDGGTVSEVTFFFQSSSW